MLEWMSLNENLMIVMKGSIFQVMIEREMFFLIEIVFPKNSIFDYLIDFFHWFLMKQLEPLLFVELFLLHSHPVEGMNDVEPDSHRDSSLPIELMVVVDWRSDNRDTIDLSKKINQ